MHYVKEYENGFRLIVKKIDGLLSVSAGILVGAGSANESAGENGISHFLEHMMFKGTEKRTAFEISDSIDRIGAQINAFTAKELTCYYVKSTAEHFGEAAEILADLFFCSQYADEEAEKEKGVVLEEINMEEDSPEDLCLDLLSEAYFGKRGYGRTILGKKENVKRFTREDLFDYVARYYTPDNVVLSVAGNVSFEEAEAIAEQYFLPAFQGRKNRPHSMKEPSFAGGHLFRSKKIEQAHVALCVQGVALGSPEINAVNLANVVFGGGMSSRLFQRIREEMGLAYSVYSYVSQYRNCGVLEVYAGVSPDKRDTAVAAIVREGERFCKEGLTKEEFLRGKEQIKSAFVYGQESAASQMLLYGKSLLFLNKAFDLDRKMAEINAVTEEDVRGVICRYFDFTKAATATVGRAKSPLSL